MTTNTTQAIDNISIKAQALKGHGSKVQAAKNSVTAQYQWIVADHVYNIESLTSILSHWMEKSELVGEARRTAKDALTNAVKAWGEDNVSIEMNERTTGNKQRGIHISYLTEQDKKDREYQASVKALVAAMNKHGHAMYDALAMIEMERQAVNITDDSQQLSTLKSQVEQEKKHAELMQQQEIDKAEKELLAAIL